MKDKSDLTNIREGIKVKVCNNPECKDNIYTHSKPVIHLGSVCWNCKSEEFLK